MLILNFEGYFQMRMATDPDPTDAGDDSCFLHAVSANTMATPNPTSFISTASHAKVPPRPEMASERTTR